MTYIRRSSRTRQTGQPSPSHISPYQLLLLHRSITDVPVVDESPDPDSARGFRVRPGSACFTNPGGRSRRRTLAGLGDIASGVRADAGVLLQGLGTGRRYGECHGGNRGVVGVWGSRAGAATAAGRAAKGWKQTCFGGLACWRSGPRASCGLGIDDSVARKDVMSQSHGSYVGNGGAGVPRDKAFGTIYAAEEASRTRAGRGGGGAPAVKRTTWTGLGTSVTAHFPPGRPAMGGLALRGVGPRQYLRFSVSQRGVYFGVLEWRGVCRGTWPAVLQRGLGWLGVVVLGPDVGLFSYAGELMEKLRCSLSQPRGGWLEAPSVVIIVSLNGRGF